MNRQEFWLMIGGFVALGVLLVTQNSGTYSRLDSIEARLSAIESRLSVVAERVAFIEGHLAIQPTPEPDAQH